MAERFYRVHWADCPPFSVGNAWSALWGSTWSEDGTQTECRSCWESAREECRICGGTGWEDALEGYSCCDSPEELVEYFAAPVRDGVVADDDRVVVFDGVRSGAGFDGEPLAVPVQVVEEASWAEFVARYG